MVGNIGILDIINNKINKGLLPNMILLTGLAGTGKSTLAKDIAKKLNKPVKVFNMAEKEKINDYINEIFNYKQTATFILEELHGLGFEQTRLLEYFNNMSDDKTIIICTTQPDEIIEGIRSRCTEFYLNPLDLEETKELIESITGETSQSYALIKTIYRYTRGIPRDIIKLVKMELDEKELKVFVKYVDNNELIALLESTKDFTSFVSYMRNKKLDKNFIWTFKDFIFDSVSYCHGIAGEENPLTRDERKFVKEFFKTINPIVLMEAVDKVKPYDVYSFLPFYKIFHDIPTAIQEVKHSESVTRSEAFNKQENDEFLSEDDILNRFGSIIK